MKPRFKINLDGSFTLIHAGVSDLSGEQIRQFMKEHSGSVMAYCRRFGFAYESTHAALAFASYSRFDRVGAMRLILGMPLTLSTQASTSYKRSHFTQLVFGVLADGHAVDDYPEATRFVQFHKGSAT